MERSGAMSMEVALCVLGVCGTITAAILKLPKRHTNPLCVTASKLVIRGV